MGIYSASKFALEGYTQTLRMELSPFDIYVSLTEAGFLETPMMNSVRQRLHRSESTTTGGNVLSLPSESRKRRRLVHSSSQNRTADRFQQKTTTALPHWIPSEIGHQHSMAFARSSIRAGKDVAISGWLQSPCFCSLWA
jgi:NAD(P)-dependent dehydrogenase (short-subunit alcohol dehydrogenase family)